MKANNEIMIKNMKEDMKKIKDEWERRLVEEETESQRKSAELVSKYSIHISNL